MRKILLFVVMALVSMTMNAQTTPVITLTAEVDGVQRTLGIGSADVANSFRVDWGDGNIVDGGAATGIYDGYDVVATELTGTPVGSGNIKIYATGAVSFFDCISKVGGTGVTALDLTNAVDLTEIDANGNKLTTIDLSKNTKLVNAQLNNNSLTTITLGNNPVFTTLNIQNNQLTSFDGSVVPTLTTLYLSNNYISTLDLSKNTSLKSVYLLNLGLTSLNMGANKTSKLYLSVNNNKLTSLDITEATGLQNGSLFAMNNNLTELKYTTLSRVNLAGNKFTLASLPTSGITTLTYAPQQVMPINDINGRIDLSAQNNLKGLTATTNSTTYTWYTKSGTALVSGTDYTENGGIFTFVKNQNDSVYCTMATPAFPNFTGSNIFKTVCAKVAVVTAIDQLNVEDTETVDAYSIDGRLIQQNTEMKSLKKGAYLIRKANKVFKVVI